MLLRSGGLVEDLFMHTAPDESPRNWRQKLAIGLCWVQGVYFFITGIWPLVDIESFQWVTGPKTDLWLVRTVGVLIAVIAAAILLAAWRKNVSPEIKLLAIGSAAGLTAIDVIYVSLDVIAPIYLLDAAAEVVLILLWGATLGESAANRRAAS
jgi:fatty acid desaturase